jgi:SAM-dependent methyltransferase
VLRAEAAWLARELENLSVDTLSPLLSVGSGHAELRGDQPWIDDRVFDPLARRGVYVLHHELEDAPGVDVAGNLDDPAFLTRLEQLEIRSVMCCNVLEHVPDAARVASAIERLVGTGGYAVVTVPLRFPFHPGPIDAMFRPRSEELRSFFPELEAVRLAEIRCESLARYWLGAPRKWASFTHGVRVAGDRGRRPAPPPRSWREAAAMAFGSTAVSAVILRRG